MLLRYSQRWVKHHSRGHLALTINPLEPAPGGPAMPARHWAHGRGPCQFIEEHLAYKLKGTCCERMAQICGPDFGFE